jgi:hypothetical protein
VCIVGEVRSTEPERCCESHYQVASTDSTGPACRSPGITADLPQRTFALQRRSKSSARHGRGIALEAVICSCRARRPRADHAAAFAVRSSTRLRPQHALPQTRSLRNCCVRGCVTTSPSPLPRLTMPPSKTLLSATKMRRSCASSQPLPAVPPPRTRSVSLRLVRPTASPASS